MHLRTVLLSLSLCARFCLSFISTLATSGALQRQPPPYHRYQTAVLLATITNEKWEWDGTVQEGAHDDEFEPIDNFDDSPSIGFMSAVAILTGSGIPGDSIGGAATTQASTILFDPLINSGMIHRLSVIDKEGDDMSEDDLLEVGGDPDFLGDDGCSVLMSNQMSASKDMNNPVLFEWDGMIDEDAHLDM